MTNNNCSNCGEPADPNGKVCKNCGKPFTLQTESENCQKSESEIEKTQPAGNVVYVKEKSTFVAIILSFFFTGAGQVYNGQLKKGLLMMIVLWIGSILILPGLVIWVYAMYDAYKEAEKMNKGEIPFAEATAKDAVIFIIAYFIIVFAFFAIVSLLMFIPFLLFGF